MKKHNLKIAIHKFLIKRGKTLSTIGIINLLILCVTMIFFPEKGKNKYSDLVMYITLTNYIMSNLILFLYFGFEMLMPDIDIEEEDPNESTEIYNSSTQWIVNFSYDGKYQMRILEGESEKSVRNNFLSVRPSARITNIICLTSNPNFKS